MRDSTMLILCFCIFLSNSSKSSISELEIVQFYNPEVNEVITSKNPDDIDYWDGAQLVWSDEFDGTSVSTDVPSNSSLHTN